MPQKQQKPKRPLTPVIERAPLLSGSSFWIPAVLALVTFLTFLPLLQNEFVNYDDPDYVYANSHVISGLSWQNIQWALTAGFASNWHPLTWMSHMLDCTLF